MEEDPPEAAGPSAVTVDAKGRLFILYDDAQPTSTGARALPSPAASVFGTFQMAGGRVAHVARFDAAHPQGEATLGGVPGETRPLATATRFEDALRADLDRWPFWRGRLLLAHGRWLRRGLRVTNSRAPLRDAREIFDAIGASSWGDQTRHAARCARRASAAGVGFPKRAKS
ncbi:MAG: hypothetical protein ABSG43_27515 [Solirubrobacteraceae bacterium]